jgi:hypothetical protein
MTLSVPEPVYTSELSGEYRAALEGLLFFHPQQAELVDAIVSSIDEYGPPRVVESDGSLRVEVERLPGLQMLCALQADASLVGVILYGRPGVDRLVVVHLAVAEDYCSHGRHADLMLPLRLLERVRSTARCLKGVRAVVMPYGDGITMRVQRGGASSGTN